MCYMYYVKVPDPILGPKGVRLLLLTRGFVGFVFQLRISAPLIVEHKTTQVLRTIRDIL